MKKFIFRIIYIACIVLILIFPIIFISLFSLAIKLGTTYMNTSGIIIDFNKPIDIGNYIEYYVTIVGIEATTILSYMVYKTSVKSNELSEAINKKEENRDDDKIKESTVIIYYDLLGKITTLKLLYTKFILKGELEVNRNILMAQDWIQNLANLRSILEKEELDILFDLYNRLELISKMQINNDKNVETLIKNLSEELFIPVFHKYLWMNFENECLLNNKYYNIFYKIQMIIDNVDKKQKICMGEISNYEIFNGKAIWKDSKDNLIYDITYKNGKIVEGKYFNYINDKYEKIFDGKFKDNNYEFTGYYTEFYQSRKIKFRGEVENNKYNGQGILYRDSNSLIPIFSGIWEKGKKISGEFKSNNTNGVIYFKGEYKHNQPYTGEIECSKMYNIGGAYGFKGTIEKGKPVNGYGYVENFRKYTDEFLKCYPEYLDYENEEMENQEDYDPYEQIPYDVRQEMIEDNIRFDRERDREMLEKDCKEIVELLECKWNNGIGEKSPDDLLYKEYFGIGQIKKS